MKRLENKTYLTNRIKECKAEIRKLERLLNEDQDEETKNKRTELLEESKEKLEFFTDKLRINKAVEIK
jgi:hypothetical protein